MRAATAGRLCMSEFSQGVHLRILLVAEHASAAFGGEALVPFQYFKRLREMHIDVHLLVHERTRTELSSAFPDDQDRLHFVTDSRVNIWCHKIGSLLPDRLRVFTVGAVSHFETQFRQRRLARALLRRYGFNIVHEPIPVSPKLPSLLFGLPVPVIIGPMNGGMDYPPNYRLDSRFERIVVSVLRWSAAFWNMILPGKRQAALLLVANKRTRDALPVPLKSKKVLELAENGVDLAVFAPPRARLESERFRIVYVGRLVDWKRVDLLIDACAGLTGKIDFVLDLIGDGPLRCSLEEEARRQSLSPHVYFHGRLAQAAIADFLRSADVLVLPSMRECGGAVILEAMAAGLPVIAANWGGPADYVSKDTGILIAPGTPREFIDELAKSLLWLARNPQERARMGSAGRQRVAALFDWRVKARALLEIYDTVLKSDAFGMRLVSR